MWPQRSRHEDSSVTTIGRVRAEASTASVCGVSVAAWRIVGEASDVEALCEKLPHWYDARIRFSGTEATVSSSEYATLEDLAEEIRQAAQTSGADVVFAAVAKGPAAAGAVNVGREVA